jgi:hypothetical protein
MRIEPPREVERWVKPFVHMPNFYFLNVKCEILKRLKMIQSDRSQTDSKSLTKRLHSAYMVILEPLPSYCRVCLINHMHFRIDCRSIVGKFLFINLQKKSTSFLPCEAWLADVESSGHQFDESLLKNIVHDLFWGGGGEEWSCECDV